MKKLPAFIVTLFLSVMMTPNLVFAVDCNSYGWKNSEDMYQALAADVWAAWGNGVGVCPNFVFASDFRNSADHHFGAPDVTGAMGVAHDIGTFDESFWTTEPYATKWGWLATYMDARSTAAGLTVDKGQDGMPSTHSAYTRYSLAAFFANSVRAEWPKSADYTKIGAAKLSAWQVYWGSSFCPMPSMPVNPYGWKSSMDMYPDFVADYNESAGSEIVTELGPGKFYNKTENKTPKVEDFLAGSDKWRWLLTFLTDQCRAYQGKEPNMTASMMRGAVDNFFNSGALNAGGWNQSYDATTSGNVTDFSSWQPYWGFSFCPMPVNTYGWKSFVDLYQDLAADILESQSYGVTGWAFADFTGTFSAPDINGNTGVAHNIQTFDLTFFTGENDYAAKWGWLGSYLDATATAAGKTKPTTNSSFMRYALAAFFQNTVRASWPETADYTKIGAANLSAWQGYWGFSFCPANVQTNSYGWKNGEDMYQALAADILESQSYGVTGWAFADFTGTFSAPDINGNTGVAHNIQTFDLTFFTGENDYAAKWGWLGSYLDATATAAGKTKPTTNSSFMRYALAAFFQNTVRASWPATADYTKIGVANLSAWQGYWGFAFDVEESEEEPEEVCNEYDWITGEDMYQALAFDIYSAKQLGLCPGFAFASTFKGAFGAPDVTGAKGVALDIQAFDESFWTTEPYATKWGWLATYLNAKNTEAGKTAATNSSANMRYSLAAFFANSVRTDWPATADYTNIGVANLSAWQPAWGHQLCPNISHYDTRAITDGKFGTICFPYDAISVEGVEIYDLGEFDAVNHRIALDPVEQLPEGGKPYIFYATTTGVLNWAYEEGAEPEDLVVENNGMIGTFDADGLTTTEEVYMIKDNALVKAAVGSYIAQYRAYIDITKIEPQPAKVGRRYIAIPRELATDMQQINMQRTSFKTIKNGRLVIMREGRMFNALGSEIK